MHGHLGEKLQCESFLGVKGLSTDQENMVRNIFIISGSSWKILMQTNF